MLDDDGDLCLLAMIRIGRLDGARSAGGSWAIEKEEKVGWHGGS